MRNSIVKWIPLAFTFTNIDIYYRQLFYSTTKISKLVRGNYSLSLWNSMQLLEDSSSIRYGRGETKHIEMSICIFQWAVCQKELIKALL